MSTALMIEIFGYIGCIFVIISMLMTSVVKLRVINTCNSDRVKQSRSEILLMMWSCQPRGDQICNLIPTLTYGNSIKHSWG